MESRTHRGSKTDTRQARKVNVCKRDSLYPLAATTDSPVVLGPTRSNVLRAAVSYLRTRSLTKHTRRTNVTNERVRMYVRRYTLERAECNYTELHTHSLGCHRVCRIRVPVTVDRQIRGAWPVSRQRRQRRRRSAPGAITLDSWSWQDSR